MAITLAEPATGVVIVRIDDDGGRLQLIVGDDDPVEVLHLPGEPTQWRDATVREFLVLREFAAGVTFPEFASALEDGQGAACGLQPIQRVDSYFDPSNGRSYCLYRAASEQILRDAFLWLGLPKADIRGVRSAER